MTTSSKTASSQKPQRPKPTQDEVDSWPDGNEAHLEFGVSPRQVARLLDSGLLRKGRASDGTWRFCREELETASRRSVHGAAGRDEVLDGYRQLLAQQISHNERSWEMVHGPSAVLLALLKETNADLRSENADLRKQHLEFLELFRKLTMAEHERKLAGEVTAQREARKDKAFEKLTDAAPGFFTQLIASLTGKSLLASIDDDQLTILADSEFLKADQRAILQEEKKRREKDKLKRESAKAETKTSAPNGAATEEK